MILSMMRPTMPLTESTPFWMVASLDSGAAGDDEEEEDARPYSGSSPYRVVLESRVDLRESRLSELVVFVRVLLQ
jgi:hypothetical protein